MGSAAVTGKKTKTSRNSYHEPTNNHRRHAKYTQIEVKCKNTSLHSKYVAYPGMMVRFFDTLTDGSREYTWGRVLGRVDAPFVKGSKPEYDSPAIKGWIAVIEIKWCGHNGFIRWVNPDTVSEIYDAPLDFPSWFFQKELPSIEHVLAADRNGSLCEPYIKRWTEERAMPGPKEQGNR